MSSNKELIIKVDMDGTVANLSKSAIKIYNEVFNDNVTDYYSSYWFKHCTKADIDYFNSLLHTEGFFLNLEPIEEMVHVVKTLSSIAKIIFVTKPLPKSDYCLIEKAQWLQKYFSDIDYDVAFTEDKYLIYGNFIIDDDLQYLTDTREIALSICYGNYDWNKEYEGYRFDNAPDMLNYIMGLKNFLF